MKLQLVTLLFFCTGLAYSVLFGGGVYPSDWHVALILIGVASLMYWLFKPPFPRTPKMVPWLKWPLLILPFYVLFQLVPLPQNVLNIVSPERAEQTEALRRIAQVELTPISVFPPATMAYFFRTLAYLAVLLTMRDITCLSSDYRWATVTPLLVIGTLEATIGVFQVAEAWPNGTARGTYVNRDHFAGLLEMILPLAIMYSAAIWLRTNTRYQSPALPALGAAGLAGIAGMMLFGIVFSLSRMGFLVALCSLFTVTLVSVRPQLRSRRLRWVSIGALGLSVIVLFVLLPPDQLIARFADMASTDKLSADDRLHMWKETLSLIRAYPWFGCGLGGFESAFGRFQISLPTYSVDYAHNDYLQVLAELGCVGAFIVVVLISAVLYKTVQGLRQMTVEERCLVIACLSSMIAMMLHSVVDFNLHIPANALALAWIAGVAIGLGDKLYGTG